MSKVLAQYFDHFALGLLAHSVRLLSFHRGFTIHEIAIFILRRPSVLFKLRFEKVVLLLELEEVTSVFDCVIRMSIPVLKQVDPSRCHRAEN